MTAITAMLDDARPELAPDLPLPKALLLPHAGYIYSGSTAALGYAALERGRGAIRRVVLLGPTHRVWTDGVVLPGVDTLGTPLGEVRVARVATELQDLPQVGVSAEAHAAEHSLEVHLPFLQMVLGDIEVVPLAVGRAEPGEVADVLDALWGGSETVVVVSSDLSHYLPYDAAEHVDEATVEQMLRLDLPSPTTRPVAPRPPTGSSWPRNGTGSSRGCSRGAAPATPPAIAGGWWAMSHWRSSVPSPTDDRLLAPLPTGAGGALLTLARGAITTDLGVDLGDDSPAERGAPSWLAQERACFVTLTRHGDLAGCIGTITPYRSLVEDVRGNARAAAFRDRRFPPLDRVDLPAVVIEVSVLSALRPIPFGDEADALAALRPGVDGVVLEYGGRRATFLPQVWDKVSGPADFLGHLKVKLGVPPAFWSEEMHISRYVVDLFSEEE